MLSCILKKILPPVLIIALLMQLFVTVVADEAVDGVSGNVSDTAEENYYYDEYENYLSKFKPNNSEQSIVLNTENVLSTECEISDDYSEKINAIKLSTPNSNAVWSVEVPVSDLYEIYFTYLPLTNKNNEITVSISVDGKYPYSALKSLSLKKFWENSVSEFETDNYGDQITPEQILNEHFVKAFANDSDGVALEPYKVYLEAGTHTVSVSVGSEPIALSAVTFEAYKTVLSYDKVYDAKKTTDKKAETIYIEGESAINKTSRSLVPKSDTYVGLTPTSAVVDLLNYIGGTSWQKAGDTLNWEFDVDAAGYYKLAFNYMQNDAINVETFRKIRIDGDVPFKEFEEVGFNYCTKWQYFELTDKNDKPYYIWLDEGPHTISMEVTLADISDYHKQLRDIVNKISDKYLEIVMITGDTPDLNRDYDLFTQIPDLESCFEEIYTELNKLSKEMKNAGDNKSNQYVAAFNNMSRVVKTMLDSPYMAHQYIKDYYTNYCTVSSWLYDMLEMPLRLDQIQLVPETEEYPGINVGFFSSFAHSFKRFINSFVSAYAIQDSDGNEAELELWVNWGIDQTKALTALIQQSFTKETGIKVNVRISNASLVKGILANNYPDVSLHLARTEPVNLGIRGALYDLSQFEDYNEVIKRFDETAPIPYSYDGEVYALPDQQAFFVMFYRKDILNEMGIEVPKTWDEFIKAATILQRKNLRVYVPYTQITTTTTVNTGIGALNIYPTLMAQHGLSIYNEEQNACQINTPKAVEVFKFWTQLYTEYKYDKQADFYNRLRVGTMPLGISSYTTYMTLKDAAPEIKGKWAIACVPGVEGGSAAVAGSGTGCGIVKKSSHKQEAWQFLKWWTSAETQFRYSENVEAMLGTVGRQHTSTVEAFKQMSWDEESKQVLLEQWSRVEEVPEIPGSYYVSRAIDQAYFAVLNKGDDYNSTMDKWNDISNGEIARKIKEYK